MWRLGLKFLLRDWRGGELALLMLGLVLSVATVTSLTAFVERVEKAFIRQSASFLAADLVVRGPRPEQNGFVNAAKNQGLKISEQTVFSSMVFAGEQLLLVTVKAVDDAYPLRGDLKISEKPFDEGEITAGGPPQGNIWVSNRVLSSLGVNVGDFVEIGKARLRITGVIQQEPDGRPDVFSAGPKVILHQSDLATTDVVQAGSRVTFKYLFAGSEAQINQFAAQIKPQLTNSQRMVDTTNNRPPIANSLDTAEDFLLLSGSIAVLLAAIALSIAARHYCRRHFQHAALMKTLGATTSQVAKIYFSLLMIFGVIASAAGVAIGYGFQVLLVEAVAELLPTRLPDATSQPMITGLVTGVVCLAGFAWPPLIAVSRVSPMNVLREQISGAYTEWLFYGLGAAAMFSLMWWYSGSLQLTSLLFGGAVVAVLLLVLLGIAFIRMLRRMVGGATSAWRWGVIALARHARQNAAQIVVFSLTIMAIMLVYQVRTSLVGNWQNQLPAEAPNHFFINIAPYEREAFANHLQSRELQSAGIYPIVRGRLSHINGQKVTQIVSKETRERAGVERELSMTWAETMPEGNELSSGKWWGDIGAVENPVSVEARLAKRMGIKMGDTLSFTVGAQAFDANVASIRTVDWDTMRPNFYMIFAPDVLADYPATYITSVHIPKSRKAELNAIAKQFPTVSVLEVDSLIEKIQNIIEQVGRAVEWILLLIVIAGALVLIAATRTSMPMRVHETALLRTLGAGRKRIVTGIALEFFALGILSAIIGSLSAVVTFSSVQTFWFQMNAPTEWWVGLWGGLLGCMTIGAVGIISAWSSVKTSPMVILRNQ